MRKEKLTWGGKSLSGGLVLDARDFGMNFNRFMDVTSKDAAKEGLGDAINTLMWDVNFESPAAPELTSALRSSMSTFVQHKKVGDSTDQRKADLSPEDFTARNYTEKIPEDTLQATLIMNAPYAAVQHEVYHPGFLSQKIFGNAGKYIRIIANRIRKIRKP